MKRSKTGKRSLALTRAVAVALVLTALAAAVLPAGAGAATPHEFIAQFGENCKSGGSCGRGAGETLGPVAAATDPSTGHVIVDDALNRRLDEFTPWGEFVKAFGWDVAPGPVDEEQEVRVRAAAGQFKLSFEAQSTADLPFDASDAEVETALEGLAAIGEVSVTGRVGRLDGTSPYVYVVRFEGAQAATNVAQLGAADGTTPLSGGKPNTSLEVRTRADGTSGGAGLESCTKASGCKVGIEGAGAGQLGSAGGGVAVDSAGDIYVADPASHRIEKFDPAGRFILTFGGGVDQTTSGNLCTAASGDVCGAGKIGTGPGEFSQLAAGAVSFISVGPGDIVYVGDTERIEKFNPDGTYAGEIDLAASHPGAKVSTLAVAPAGSPEAGDLYVGFNDFESPKNKFPNIFVLHSDGSQACEIKVGSPMAVAADREGNLYLYADRVNEDATEFASQEIREYDPSASCEERLETFAVRDFERIAGIGTNGIGDVYAGNISLNGANSYVRAYGPGPVGYELPPPAAPVIAAEYPVSVGTETAALGAQVNPKFWADATYYVEYGLENCETSTCQATPAPPGVPLGEAAVGSPVTAKAITLSGLAPGTTYHYRFVASSSGGGPTFGADRTFRTQPPAEGLPDGRVYERSSPAQKESGEVAIPEPAGGGADFTVQLQQASPGGEVVSYASASAFGEAPESAPAASQYLSRRQGGGLWSTKNIDPRFEEGFLRDPVVGFSPDLSHAALYVIEPPLSEEAPAGYPNLYWRDEQSGTLATLATRAPLLGTEAGRYCLYYGGSSADATKVFFAARGALLDGEAGEEANTGFNLYEWSAERPPAEALRLASVLPGGAAAKAAGHTSFGRIADFFLASNCRPTGSLMRHAVSADGSRVFWTYEGTYAGPKGKAQNPLFALVGGSETVQLDAPQGTTGAGGAGEYWDASADGSKVFFTDAKKLVTGATAEAGKPDLYRYDFTAAAGKQLQDLTPHPGEAASVLGVMGASEDGSYVYFVANGVLDAEPNSEGETAKAGAKNLYAWHEGAGVRFVAGLAGEDSPDWSASPREQTARVSPDGRALAFLSTQRLTDFENAVVPGKAGCKFVGEGGLQGNPACAEAFLYDYSPDALACASCAPSGARPHGPAFLPTWRGPYQQSRYLSDGGDRLFFETLDPLVAADANEKRDVYEFERSGTGGCHAESLAFEPETGFCLYLLSGGESSGESYFLDASASGDDVFLSTREQLTGADEDERYDVFDARVGGEAPPTPPAECEAEGCRPQVGPPPPPTAPATSQFAGPGNPTPTRPSCPKGTRKVKTRGKTRCLKPHKHRRHRRHRTSQRRAAR